MATSEVKGREPSGDPLPHGAGQVSAIVICDANQLCAPDGLTGLQLTRLPPLTVLR